MMTDFSESLQSAAEALSLDMDETQQRALLDYLAQLQRWNKTYNLTAIRDPWQMLVQHVFDSLAVVVPMRRYLQTEPDVRLLDIGSGAGLPGVVLGIMQPHWQVTCIDAVEKKTAFIQQVARVLKLGNVSSQHVRIEMLPEAGATMAVSRAFSSLKDFALLTGRHIKSGGQLLAMKGKIPDNEISELERDTAWHVDAIESLHVPMLDAQRCLVWLKRRESHEPG